jgi:hypothetical protein
MLTHLILYIIRNKRFIKRSAGSILMTVFDCDFLHDDIERVAQANLIATIIDGEEVCKAV